MTQTEFEQILETRAATARAQGPFPNPIVVALSAFEVAMVFLPGGSRDAVRGRQAAAALLRGFGRGRYRTMHVDPAAASRAGVAGAHNVQGVRRAMGPALDATSGRDPPPLPSAPRRSTRAPDRRPGG